MPRIARPPARAACVAASGVLVAGIGVLAFDSGGYFEDARALAGVVAWTLLALLALVLPPERLVPSRAGVAALGGLTLLAAWTAIAKSWSPLPEVAGDDVELLVLYVGGFAAGLLALAEPAARRWLEPGIVIVAVVVVAYGLGERFLPGVLDYADSPAAVGRLTQPLTYWNGMGALAAIGLVLAVRAAAGSGHRSARVVAGAATPLLGLGVYLSFSRAALLAAAVGIGILVLAVPRRSQLAAALVALGGGAAAALLVTRYPAVESLAPGRDAEREGLEMLLLTVLLCSIAGAATYAGSRGVESVSPSVARRRAAGAIAALVVLIPVIAAPLAIEAGDAPDRGADAERFGSVASNRYEYWRVALESVPDRPIKGLGPGGFHVEWMRERPIDEAPHDAHSLQLETAAELGLPGLVALALFAAAVASAGASALRRRPAAAAGALGALVAWTLTSSVDWIWEMPALGLLGVFLSADLLGQAAAPAGSEAEG